MHKFSILESNDFIWIHTVSLVLSIYCDYNL